MEASTGRSVANGVYRLGTSLVNWYLVEEDGAVTVVDAGLPGYWSQLEAGMRPLGRKPTDVEAVILTHAHGDHIGVAERIRTEAGATVYVHEDDEEMATEGTRPRTEGSPLPHLRRPAALRLITHLARNGGLRPPKIGEVTTFKDGQKLRVPGRPRVVHTPGHTNGHVAFQFEDREAYIVGDALCTLNPLTGSRGPQIMPSAFNVSSDQALDSLDSLSSEDSATLLFGHGEPWSGTLSTVVARAREAGPS